MLPVTELTAICSIARDQTKCFRNVFQRVGIALRAGDLHSDAARCLVRDLQVSASALFFFFFLRFLPSPSAPAASRAKAARSSGASSGFFS